MTPAEAARLLGLASGRDGRKPSHVAAAAWATDLADVDFTDAQEALARHFRESTDWVMPAHIRAHAKVIRDERRKGTSAPLQLMRQPEDPAERRAINTRGAEACRQALHRETDDVTLDHDDPIRDRALRRARAEKRERQMAPVRNPEMPGLIRQATRHLQIVEDPK